MLNPIVDLFAVPRGLLSCLLRGILLMGICQGSNNVENKIMLKMGTVTGSVEELEN